MTDLNKMISYMKRRRYKMVALVIVGLMTLYAGLYGQSILKRYEAAFSQEFFQDHISGKHCETELPIVLSEMYKGSMIQSYLIMMSFFHFALSGFFFATFLTECFASQSQLKVAMWEKIQKLEQEVENLKKQKNDQTPKDDSLTATSHELR